MLGSLFCYKPGSFPPLRNLLLIAFLSGVDGGRMFSFLSLLFILSHNSYGKGVAAGRLRCPRASGEILWDSSLLSTQED